MENNLKNMIPPRIVAVKGSTPKSLTLRYSNNELVEVDFLLLLDRAKNASSGMLADFRQEGYLATATVTPYGALAWPNGYDACPDALYLRGRLIFDNTEAA